MKKSIKNAFAVMSSLVIAATANLQAECVQELQDCNVNYCCETPCGKAFVFGEFLYLKAAQTGLDYCFSNGFTVDTIGDTTLYSFDSSIKDPKFKWKPGYRVGGGYAFAESEWDVAAVYTHLDSNASVSQGVQSLNWKLHFDVVDVVLGTKFFPGCDFMVKLFAGVRGAEIKQHTFSNRVNDFLELAKIDNNKQDFRGIGPVAGVFLKWDMGCGFGIYAEGDVAALYGTNHNHYNNAVIRVGEIRTQVIHQNTDAYQGALDAGLGIKWGKEFCNDKRMYVSVGVELHRYFSFNRLGDHDDLCIDGVNAGLGFEF